MYSSRQLMFGIATFIGGSTLFTVFTTQITFQDSWLSALLALTVSLLVVWIYTGLIGRFPGYGLLEIHSVVYGKWIGFFINLIYTLFCIAFAVVSLRNLGNFFTGYIMPDTPMVVILALLSVTCAFAASCGITVVLRNAFLFFLFMFSALLTNSLLLLPNMHLYNFLPVLQLGWDSYAKGSFVLAAAPFCEIIVFLILLPYADRNANVKKSFFLGLLLGALYLLITFIRDIATLGIALMYLTEPSYEAVRLINVMDVFSRLEIIFAFAMIVMRVFKLSVIFCAIIRAVEDTFHRTFPKKTGLLTVISVLSISCAIYLFQTGMSLPEWFRHTGAFVFAGFEMGLPLITLIIASIRRIKMKKT